MRPIALDCGVIKPEEDGSIMEAEEFNRLIRNEEGDVRLALLGVMTTET